MYMYVSIYIYIYMYQTPLEEVSPRYHCCHASSFSVRFENVSQDPALE